MKKLMILLILILILNTVMAIEEPIAPPSPNDQVFERIRSIDDKLNLVIKSQIDFGTNISNDMNTLAKGSDLNQMQIVLSEKIDRKLEVPILVIALILNNILIGAFVFYLKAQGRI